MTSIYGGKADGLFRLSNLQNITVPEFTAVPADSDETATLKIINHYLKNRKASGPVAVRSSALTEDTEESSMAGAFDTFLNVSPDADSILEAIRKIKALGQEKVSKTTELSAILENQVGIVIQDMVVDPEISGVILSTNPTDLNKNYTLVNYAYGYGTEIVSGQQSGRVLSVARNIKFKEKTLKEHPFLDSLMVAFQEIEQDFDQKAVDVEFCYKNGQVYILQARPMVIKDRILSKDSQFNTIINDLTHEIVATIDPNDFYGDMIDINPRELLGDNVENLNITIFEDMFAESIVEEVRETMGYHPLMGGLLKKVGNKPYVSLRNSAFSMRPAGLDNEDYDILYQVYKEKLECDSSLQDSVEFSVFAITSATLDRALQEKTDISEERRTRLRNVFTVLEGKIYQQIQDFPREYEAFSKQYDQLLKSQEESSLDQCMGLLQKGTRFFVKAARLAFFNKLFFETKYGCELTENALAGVQTVSTELFDDLIDFAENKMDEKTLEEKYGHLRMGQMNILSEPYSADIRKHINLDYYTRMDSGALSDVKQEKKIKAEDDHAFLESCDPEVQGAIRNLRILFSAREGVKFKFMKAYQQLTNRIEHLAHTHCLDIHRLVYLSFYDIISLEKGDLDAEKALDMSERAKNLHATFSHVKLPETLNKDTDLGCIEQITKIGNFFTKDIVEAPYIVIDEGNIRDIKKEMIENKIVILDRADPGFDGVLMCKPAGIITKVGGPASHISIRVNELQIPACVGSGINITEFHEDKMIVLDCKNKKIYEGSKVTSNVPR